LNLTVGGLHFTYWTDGAWLAFHLARREPRFHRPVLSYPGFFLDLFLVQ
jgi:hypothetical protein